MTDNERKLIEQLKEGYEPAWAQLFDTFSPKLLECIKRVVDDQGKVEDLTGHIMLMMVATIRHISIAPADPQ